VYEFLHRSRTAPSATGQSSQVSGQVWVQFAVLGAVLIAFEVLVDGTVGVLAGQIGGWLRRRQTARRRIATAVGGVFIGLGVRLAAER
jgi:threonine/homoserine/homoserine lactone efflux protein